MKKYSLIIFKTKEDFLKNESSVIIKGAGTKQEALEDGKRWLTTNNIVIVRSEDNFSKVHQGQERDEREQRESEERIRERE